jgi:hypothetical protein
MFTAFNETQLAALTNQAIMPAQNDDFDTLGATLEAQAIKSGDFHIMGKSVKDSFKAELYLLFCGSQSGQHDPYAAIRDTLSDISDKAYTALITSIALVMAPFIGVTVVLITPFIAAALLMLTRIGHNWACEILS